MIDDWKVTCNASASDKAVSWHYAKASFNMLLIQDLELKLDNNSVFCCCGCFLLLEEKHIIHIRPKYLVVFSVFIMTVSCTELGQYYLLDAL